MTTAGGIAGRLAPTLLADTTDADLLRRFTADRDGAAFAALVNRHGPMVFGVCRRVLRDWHIAEDAFQASFLVLARRAADISRPAELAGWLHGVAHRVANKACHGAHKRLRREQATDAFPDVPARDLPALDDLHAVLDEEIRRLPGKYRDLLVACDLEGRPRVPVAESMGIPEGTLSSRLTTARKMLAERLAKRGVVPALVAAIMAGTATAAGEVPRGALTAAAKHGSDVPATVPATVLALTNGVTRATIVRRFVPYSLLLVVVSTAIGIAAATAGKTEVPAPDSPEQTALAQVDLPLLAHAPVPAHVEPAWMMAFRKRYELKEGEHVKRVGPPYPESRSKLFDQSEPGHIPSLPRSPADSVLCYRFDGRRTTHWGLMGRDDETGRLGTTLNGTLGWAFGLPPQVVEGDGALLGEFVEGEFVLRTGTPPEKWVPELERILRDECQMPVRLTLREVKRDVVVASGQLDAKLLKAKDPVAVSLRLGQFTGGRGGGGSGTFAVFLDHFGAHLNRHVVSEVAPAPGGTMCWSFDSDLNKAVPRAGRDQGFDADLRAVEAQTGLTFKVESRKVRVLEVTRGALAGK